ncbi:bZIP domain-containing protein [Phanerochaete sordida]|uniref:BZIP domain-containing protein n=1 Tax=Phanerochaete sordida TaxID=48140 RepID=A0A9P3LK31_9APHY|nr:bZIP domain-containing protein [Phanerochaete sordida]
MSHLIHSDAPLSPLSDWDHAQQYSPTSLEFPPSLHFNYTNTFPSPPRSVGSTSSGSPIPVSRVLRGRMSPDDLDNEQLCLPTAQVFDMTYAPSPDTYSSSPASVQEALPSVQASNAASIVPCKRASSVTPSASKKPRATAVSTKDFVPPDVTGLSKREARLVKNRAAAFLSRQRKREEFETMEQRVAELEQENARLLALAQGSVKQEGPQELLSEVEQLRAQLAEAQRREQELNDALSQKSVLPAKVKAEAVEPQLSLSTSRYPSQMLNKSSASLGLMVLLCALPTLLSLPTQSAVPTTFSLPLSNANSVQAAASTFDMNSLVTGDFDWLASSGSVMDLDIDSHGRITPGSFGAQSASSVKKLEFVDADSEALGLSGLDISFDATPSHDGKIRVRIHPPSTDAHAPQQQFADDDQSMWGGSDGGDADPFLGVGGVEYGIPMDAVSVQQSASSFDYDYGVPQQQQTQQRRRVRIALKSMPGEGREGGEWEVQLC